MCNTHRSVFRIGLISHKKENRMFASRIAKYVSTVACIAAGFCGAVNAAGLYQDWWWNPNQSGQGLNIGQQGDTLFVSWFTYDATGQPLWLTLAGNVVNNTLEGDLLRFNGPPQGVPYDSALVANRKEGTGKITFSGLSTAAFEWQFTSGGGSMSLERFSFGTPAIAGTYLAQCVGGNSCPGGVPTYVVPTTSTVTVDGTNINISDSLDGGGRCTFTGVLTNEGSITRAIGTYSCSTSAQSGAWNSALQFSPSGTQNVLSRQDTMTRTAGNCAIRQTVVGSTLLR
jgi:hypothetical protein